MTITHMLLTDGRTRPIRCVWQYDQTARLMRLVRLDTGAYVQTREPTPAER